ncbi:hypothetical protein [Niabella ginsengisoli]|uniref:Sialate O-acetylesterase n=1 Tax=Niabella ginsengisoli TaxID=522298 RepID=A0ABS9SDN0_9BACT|nr:hypothetical protein [Niabella ginsengisoli]MCH5596465.1 hypothetical protein [Niabella ginsengisoli]
MKRKILLIFLSAINLQAIAQLKMPAMFNDSMVLQQNANAPVWGWAAPGQKVEVSGSWSEKKYRLLVIKPVSG